MHFGEEKAKLTLFPSKSKRENIKKLHIKYRDIQIKQKSKLKHLGFLLDKAMSGEAMALNVIIKINNKIKFLHRKNSFSKPALRRPFYNALTQPDFNYACSAWYPNLIKKIEHRIQTTQNKCMRLLAFK